MCAGFQRCCTVAVSNSRWSGREGNTPAPIALQVALGRCYPESCLFCSPHECVAAIRVQTLQSPRVLTCRQRTIHARVGGESAGSQQQADGACGGGAAKHLYDGEAGGGPCVRQGGGEGGEDHRGHPAAHVRVPLCPDLPERQQQCVRYAVVDGLATDGTAGGGVQHGDGRSHPQGNGGGCGAWQEEREGAQGGGSLVTPPQLACPLASDWTVCRSCLVFEAQWAGATTTSQAPTAMQWSRNAP